MGTLFAQKARESFDMGFDPLREWVEEYQAIAKATGASFAEVLEVAKVIEMARRNDLYIANGNVFDEQMAGFGELLGKVSGALNEISSAIDRFPVDGFPVRT